MFSKRRAGILLHPTSLPGTYGIGEIGKYAYDFVDFLEQAGQSLWQILPLVFPGKYNAPYSAFSAFAGNPYLISIDSLINSGLLSHSDIKIIPKPAFKKNRIDFPSIKAYKKELFSLAYIMFKKNKTEKDIKAFERFNHVNSFWLDDFSLFMAIKQRFNMSEWNLWERKIASYNSKERNKYKDLLKNDIEKEKFLQFIFFNQWQKLKEYANSKGILIIGDIPIFVDFDSADVWAHKEIFKIDRQLNPITITGVPPDYFSEDGQLWGHPHYNWKKIENTGFDWWIKRIGHTMTLIDIARIDHFRGFSASWEVKFGEKTAKHGKWLKVPGEALFNKIKNTFYRESNGQFPFIAEDLGVITKDVIELRKKYFLPGMRVLQFGMTTDPKNSHNPYNFDEDSVAYTGTHDNNTSMGWFKELNSLDKKRILRYTGGNARTINWDMIRLVMNSKAIYSIIPFQDYLGYGKEARFNTPAVPDGNWEWRFQSSVLTTALAKKIRDITEIYGRLI